MQHLKSLTWIACSCLLVASTSIAAADEPRLAQAPSRYLDHVSVLPGVDFSGYTKVLLQPASVSLRSDWLSDMNANRIALLRGTTQQDADMIAREAAKGLDGSLARAFRQGRYEVVAQPGPGVITLVPRITKLYVNAPRSVVTQPGRTYVTNAGEGRYTVELRDSTTGRLVAQIADERRAGDRGGGLRLATPASNAFDFGSTFDWWAHGTVQMLDAAREAPVAAGTPLAQ